MTSVPTGSAESLADFTSVALIVPGLRGRDSSSVIQELSHALKDAGRIADPLAFYHAALNREFLASTDADGGIALPHARMPGLDSLAFAFGRTREPLHWSKTAAHPVSLVFLIAVPGTSATQYLQLISGLARLSNDGAMQDRLKAAQGAGEILSVLREIPLRRRAPARDVAAAASVSR